MKKLLLATSAAVLLTSFAAKAECDGIYGAIRAGYVKHSADKLQGNFEDRRFMMSGALGYRWEYFRTELEYVWRKYNRDRSTPPSIGLLKTYSYMWNAYYDILPYNWWTPYVGAGIGFTKIRYLDKHSVTGLVNEEWATTKFTWALGGGLSLKVTNRWNIDAGYRYYNLGSPKRPGKTYKVKAQEIYGGIRYVF